MYDIDAFIVNNNPFIALTFHDTEMSTSFKQKTMEPVFNELVQLYVS